MAGLPLKPKNQTFVLRLTAVPNCPDPIRALRGLLKIALRRFGLRCISVEQVQP
jgi:hypothetical protein